LLLATLLITFFKRIKLRIQHDNFVVRDCVFRMCVCLFVRVLDGSRWNSDIVPGCKWLTFGRMTLHLSASYRQATFITIHFHLLLELLECLAGHHVTSRYLTSLRQQPHQHHHQHHHHHRTELARLMWCTFLTSGHSDAQPSASTCPDVKKYKWRLNPVWHRMLYSCTHMATVDVKRLKEKDNVTTRRKTKKSKKYICLHWAARFHHAARTWHCFFCLNFTSKSRKNLNKFNTRSNATPMELISFLLNVETYGTEHNNSTIDTRLDTNRFKLSWRSSFHVRFRFFQNRTWLRCSWIPIWVCQHRYKIDLQVIRFSSSQISNSSYLNVDKSVYVYYTVATRHHVKFFVWNTPNSLLSGSPHH